MIQMKPTEKGFLIKDINMDIKDSSGLEEVKVDTTDYLNEMGAFLNDTSMEHSKKQLCLVTSLSNVLCRSYVDTFDILEQQSSNTLISDIGWQFLTKVVCYLIRECKYKEDNNYCTESELNNERIDLGRYFVNKSFLNTQELDDGVVSDIISRRSEDLVELRKRFNATEMRFPIVDYFTSPMYRDATLTNKFITLFFW